jgi:hypothetical protein
MDSSLVNKIYKARLYAEEPERIHILNLDVEMQGDDRLHRVTFTEDDWSCDCEYFRSHRICAHSMALERVLAPMLKATV